MKWRPGSAGRAPARLVSRRTLWRRGVVRRVVAALVAALGVGVAVHAVAPGDDGRAVVMAATELPVGHRLERSDLVVHSVPAESAPRSAPQSPEELVGKTLGRPVGDGEIVSAGHVRPAAGLTGLPATRRGLHVPVADPGTLGTIRDGDHVDVVSLADGSIVGVDLLVLSVDGAPEQSGFGVGGGGDGRGVVLAVPVTALAKLVAALGSRGDGVQLALRPATGTPAS